MELTDAQNRTIKALGLEVEHRRPKCGEVIVYTDGTCGLAVFDFQTDSVPVVVRPALAARVKELEEKLAAESLRLAWADKSLEIRNDNIRVLQEQVAALESELAPIRALKVGSWQWAMVQYALGEKVRDCCNRPCGVNTIRESNEPFTLYTPPAPAPTADELCAAIEAYEQAESGMQAATTYGDMRKLASAYRAANAKGGA